MVMGMDVTALREARTPLLSLDELMDMFGLNYSEARFVSFYVANPTNASACVREAGYSAKSAHSTASDLLRRDDVAAAIAHEMMKLQERTRITQDRILHELAILSFSNVNDFVVTEDGELALKPGVPEYVMRAVQSVKRSIKRVTDPKTKEVTEYIELEIKLWNKGEALRLAGQHFGMYKEKVEVSGTVNHNHRQVWEIGGRQISFG